MESEFKLMGSSGGTSSQWIGTTKFYCEIQPVHPKGDQSWVFIGRTDVEAETPVLWPSDAKS